MEERWKDKIGRIINVFDDKIIFLDEYGEKNTYQMTNDLKAQITSNNLIIMNENQVILEIGIIGNEIKANRVINFINGSEVSSYNTEEDILMRFQEIGVTDVFGTRKEIRELPKLLNQNEKILYATSGFLEGNTWLIVSTDQRVLFLDKGMIYGIKVKEYKLDKINSVTYSKGVISGKLMVSHGSGSFIIENINKETVDVMANVINQSINEFINKTHTKKPSENFSVADEILKFKELLDLGIISEAEFETKKKELLGL